MKAFRYLLLPLLSAPVAAEEYQFFGDLSGSTSVADIETESVFLNAGYYFSPRETLGPLDKFDYINRISRISVSSSYVNWKIPHNAFGDLPGENIHQTDRTNSISGNYYLGRFGFGASAFYQNEEYQGSSLSSDFFIKDNWTVSLGALVPEDGDERYIVNSAYTHQVNASDYIGISIYTIDDSESNDTIDSSGASAEYFRALKNGQYLSINGDYNNYGGYSNSNRSDSFSLGVRYFLSKATSFTVGHTNTSVRGSNTFDSSNYSLSAKHFFSENFATSFGVSLDDSDRDDSETYSLSLSLQL